MSWLTIIKAIIVAAATFLVTDVPLIVKFMQELKARKNAQIEAEKTKALNDMLATAQAFVQNAEKAFEGYDKMLKQQGESAGAMKKDNVITKLQTYALQHGYDFDVTFWDEKIDEIVAFTKNVNAKKKNVQ